jgi:hypothetical protein
MGDQVLEGAPQALGLALVVQVPLEACLLALFLGMLAGALLPSFLLRTLALFLDPLLVAPLDEGIELTVDLRASGDVPT